MSKPKIIGNLVIVAYKAKNLPEREIVGKQDPFVVFRIGEALEKTKTDLRGGQHPTWDDQVTLPIPEKKNMVVVQVYDEDRKRQELISECELDISNVLAIGEEDNWYPLTYRGRSAGEIYLEMTFYAARPPPKRQPTRFGMSKHLKPAGGYVPSVPPPSGGFQHNRPYPASPHYPPPPTNGRPPAPSPLESHSTPTHQGSSPYPPHQQQQRPPFNLNIQDNAPRPYPPPNPTPSMSTGSQHFYPPQQHQPYPPNNNSRPNSYVGPSSASSSRPNSYGGPSANSSRPTSPPVPGSTNFSNTTATPLLSSSYNPPNNNISLSRPNYGYPAPSINGSIYPPQHSNNNGYPGNNNAGNRNSYPNYSSTSSPYPTPQQSQYGGFPEPQQFPGGYLPHSDPLGTPFAAHQGTFPPPPSNGFPPPNNGSYPPSNGSYPPHQPGGYPPNANHPPY